MGNIHKKMNVWLKFLVIKIKKNKDSHMSSIWDSRDHDRVGEEK